MTKIIVIAGHGSDTPGKRTPNIPGYGVEKEHSINCRTAYYMTQALERCGFETVKVGWKDKAGKNDDDISITKRQRMVKLLNADASIDCHANASNSNGTFDSASGAATYISNMTSKRQQSERLAKLVQSHLCQGTVQKDRGVKSGDLGMCNATYMGTKASILIEIGFMTNLTEAKLMLTDAFCKEQAEDTAKGVCEFFGKTYKAETSTSPASPIFKIGTVYQLKYAMKVRSTPHIPGTGEKSNVLKHSELSANAQKYDSDGNGTLDAGTLITCKETKTADGYLWMRTPSGWMAAVNISSGKVYIGEKD